MTAISIRHANWDNEEDRAALKQIRRSVFIEEQLVPEDMEWDIEDTTALHYLAFDGNDAIACARLQADGQLGRMAVLKSHRHQGVGSSLLKFVITEDGYNKPQLFLHAQTHAINLYKKAGFHTEGDEFDEAGIPHVAMNYKRT